MLIQIIDQDIGGIVHATGRLSVSEFLAENPSYIDTDFNFTEEVRFYEYVNNEFVFKSGWEVTKATEEAEALVIANAVEAARAANSVREDRDERLSKTDFYALSDVVMTTEMTAYRQALRAVPEQEGFPHTITWPTEVSPS